MDAYGVLVVAFIVGLLPSIVAATFVGARYCKPSSKVHEDHEKSVVTANGLTVGLMELQGSRSRLRWGITYSTVQLGWLILAMSFAPIAAWLLDAPGWRDIATAARAATTYLVFTPFGACCMLLGIFPNDSRSIRTALVLLTIMGFGTTAMGCVAFTTQYYVARPTLMVHNAVGSVLTLCATLLLWPAWSNACRCGKPRSGCLGWLCCPPHFTPAMRLDRLWLALRVGLVATGVNTLTVTLLRVYAPVDQWSRIGIHHADFLSNILVASSALLHGLLFSPTVRFRIHCILGRRARPKPSDHIAAHLSGFHSFYDAQSLDVSATTASNPRSPPATV